MERRVLILTLIFLGGGIALLSLRGPGHHPAPRPGEENQEGFLEELKLFSKAIGAVEQAYPENRKPRELLYAAVDGILHSLDTYSEFIYPQNYELLQLHMKGEYAGIGVVLQSVDQYPVIQAVQPGSSAERHHLQPLDKILAINGNSMKDQKISEAAKLLRGEEMGILKLTLWRESAQKTLEIEVEREKIQVESVRDARMISKSIAYMRILTFQENTAVQFDQAIQSLSQQGMKALIMDLRDNSGGVMTQAVELAQRFLPKGDKIVSVESKIEQQKKDFYSSGEKTLPAYRLVVFVNGQSASASEIFSAAMQDHQRAVIIGTKTFGKGSVQSVVPLDEVSAMKLTTARYRSPLGRVIDGIGITPDETVDIPLPQAGSIDPYFLKALFVLKEIDHSNEPQAALVP